MRPLGYGCSIFAKMSKKAMNEYAIRLQLLQLVVVLLLTSVQCGEDDGYITAPNNGARKTSRVRLQYPQYAISIAVLSYCIGCTPRHSRRPGRYRKLACVH